MVARSRNRRKIGNVKRAKAGIAVRARDAAQDVWLAGLNLMAKVQDHADRLADNFAANATLTALAEKVLALAGGATQLAQVGSDTVLERAGVASRRDIEVLSRRLSKLAKEVEKLAEARKMSGETTQSMAPRVPV